MSIATTHVRILVLFAATLHGGIVAHAQSSYSVEVDAQAQSLYPVEIDAGVTPRLSAKQVERSILERFGQPAPGVVQSPEGHLFRPAKAFEVTAMRCVSGSLLPMPMFSEAEPEKVYSPKVIWVVEGRGNVGVLGSAGARYAEDSYIMIDDATGEDLARGVGAHPIDNIPRHPDPVEDAK